MQSTRVPSEIELEIELEHRKFSEHEQRIASIAFESQEGMLITDGDAKIIKVNEAFTSITGYTQADLVGKNPRIFKSDRQDRDFFEAMWMHLNQTGLWEGEIWNTRRNGEIYPGYLTITVVKDADGRVTNYVANYIDISMKKESEKIIDRLAFYDPLTSLPNRRLLIDRLNQALLSFSRTGRFGAVLMIDLDNFKKLNDIHGHGCGDILLKLAAQRLVSNTRKGDTVARLGGDEFVVILEDFSQIHRDAEKQVEVIAHKILQNLNVDYNLSFGTYKNTSSIGISMFGTKNNMDDLLKQADIAMYEAKRSGRNTIRFFTDAMSEAILERVKFEDELETAIEDNQFELYYQPQVDCDGGITGAEALIRWHHIERNIGPTEFIRVAEESNLIVPIGKFVLKAACARLKIWQQFEKLRHLTVAINISAKHFYEPSFVQDVIDEISKNEIDPNLLKIELTESVLIKDVDETICTMNKLNKIGIKFSLDDFGTGYSSLQYLKLLPLQQLKIDQSFVRDLETNEDDREITRTIISMAQVMRLTVIAEGVEDITQRTLLEQYGCRFYQGYFYGKPMPAYEFEEYVNK